MTPPVPAYIVTGANSGLGFETARHLVDGGAHVVLAVRDTRRGVEAAARMTGTGTTSVVELDLADLDQVGHCAATLLGAHDHLAGLVCNAGIMGGPPMLTAQGLERQMGTNHLGHAALVAALWPLLDASRSRVVLVSSGEARTGQLSASTTHEQLLHPHPYNGPQVYRNSKQANLLFAMELHRRSRAAGSVSAVAAHPGAVATNLLGRQLDRAGRRRLAAVSTRATSVVLRSAAAGAQSSLLALDSSTPSGAFVAPSGLGQLRGAPQIARVYPSCSSPATAARIWELTEHALATAGHPISTHTTTRRA